MSESLRVLVSQALSFGLQILFLLVAARALGPDVQGSYGVARTCAYLVETFMWFGLTSGATYLIASNFERYHAPLFIGTIGYLSVAVTISVPVIVWVLPRFGISLVTASLVLAWIVTLAAMQLFLKVFVAQQRYELYNRIYLLISATAFAPFLVLWYLDEVSLHGVIACNIFANLLGVLLSIAAHRQHLSKLRAPHQSLRGPLGELYAVGFKGYVSSVAFLLLYRADFFIVGYFVPESLGVYTVAVFVGEAVQKVPDWLGLVLVPKVSANQDADAKLTLRFLLASLAFVAVVALVTGGAALIDLRYLELLLGAEYVGVEIIVLALLPKAAIHCVIAIVGARLAGHGYTIYHPAAGVLAFSTLVAMDIVLFQRFGLSAAIIGITIAYGVASAILAVGARRVAARAVAPLAVEG